MLEVGLVFFGLRLIRGVVTGVGAVTAILGADFFGAVWRRVLRGALGVVDDINGQGKMIFVRVQLKHRTLTFLTSSGQPAGT